MLKLIPNILTFGRLVLTIVFLVMILCSPYIANNSLFLDIAFVLFVIAGLTDIVDGIVARSLNITSKFGRMMDPLVDKILVCGAFICFAIIGEPKLFNLPETTMTVIQWSVAAILILREVYVTALRHIAEARGINFAATVSGKIKMFLQSFAIGIVIIKMAHAQTATWSYWFTTVTFTIMLLVTIVSGIRATQRSSRKQTSSD
ncbi:MAG: CDP-alcohol phosphatidyltransferase family protein [Planctomycetota bacterium]|jgi:CDP-diacylglycerol--glycerol-3-phosphate 3-phosphatidyltransferase